MSFRVPATVLSLAFCAVLPLSAQEGYRLPPQDVVDIVDAAPAPSVSISPDGRWKLATHRSALPSIADVSRRMLRLAGMRIDPAANARFTTRFIERITLSQLEGEDVLEVKVNPGNRIASVMWAPDSAHFVYTVVIDDGSELWAVAPADLERRSWRVTGRLNTVLGGPSFSADGKRILCRLVPPDRAGEPAPPAAPSGPNIQSTEGERSPLRTYQDLLASEHDAQLFEHYATAELVSFPLAGGEGHVHARGMVTSASFSPDGEWLLHTRIERPFSFLMPYYSFPSKTAVRRADRALEGGGEDYVLISKRPLQKNVPIGGVATGRRDVQWKASAAATLAWVEALDGGDPERKVEHRDQWWTLAAPFEGGPSELARVEHRARGLDWFADPEHFLTSEYDRDRRWTRTILHTPQRTSVLEDRSVRDRYGDPGSLVTERGPFGRRVVRRDGVHAWRTGDGASPEGVLPFLDRLNLGTLETERVWRSAEDAYESVVKVLEGATPALVTRHQTKTDPPNYRLRRPGTDVVALTRFADPTPQLRGVTKKLLRYERADGVPLSGTLYLPANYQEGERLPLFVWAYPREYNDPRTAGQVTTSEHRFTSISGSSHLVLVTQGWAVLDGATMPVIGDAETMNDTFREQIVDAAEAAIAAAVGEGVADPARVAVGGHSYGAFMTANLLAHCDLFRAGVARSGAYNRTLTPFGFQSERRTVWQALETYCAVSPFMHADKIGEPILLVHGEVDNNSGTFPMQSRRLFQAIKGNGGTARLVMLPNESHGYRARESVLHVHAETIDWLERHVKTVRTVEARFEGGGR
ncbi:MAG: S9 family peptidase [bacterium]|nr:S9 family peptidase [bacterium]